MGANLKGFELRRQHVETKTYDTGGKKETGDMIVLYKYMSGPMQLDKAEFIFNKGGTRSHSKKFRAKR